MIVPGTVLGAVSAMAIEAVPGTGVQPKLETEAEAEIGIEADTVTQLEMGVEAEIETETEATWLSPD